MKKRLRGVKSEREKIPVALIGELASKITPQQWITIYERNRKKQTFFDVRCTSE